MLRQHQKLNKECDIREFVCHVCAKPFGMLMDKNYNLTVCVKSNTQLIHYFSVGSQSSYVGLKLI